MSDSDSEIRKILKFSLAAISGVSVIIYLSIVAIILVLMVFVNVYTPLVGQQEMFLNCNTLNDSSPVSKQEYRSQTHPIVSASNISTENMDKIMKAESRGDVPVDPEIWPASRFFVNNSRVYVCAMRDGGA